MQFDKRNIIAAVLFTATALAAVIICPFSGIVWISPFEMFSNDQLNYVMMTIRIPRTLVAMCAGGGLAVCGMIFQAIFRNPLADPFTIGVSSGASLGAAVCITTGIGGAFLGLPVVIIGAFTGALCSVFLIYAFALSHDSNSSTLLLAGVIVATVCSGLIMFIHFSAGLHQSFQIVRWLMGSVDGISWQLLLTVAIPLILFFIVIIPLLPQLDQFLTGDSIAHSRGVNLNKSRIVFISVTALAVGAIVAVCGPIGFVGIIAPHACRLIIPGVRHRMLMYCSFLTGGTFLVITDTLARSLVPPTEIPVGIITSILGGPIFLVLLFNRRSRILI